MDRTGQTLLGKYELTRLLGRGGMGEVWEGEHAITGRRVAVKVLSEKYLSNRKVVKRFGREARAASAVNHPGIVEILDQDRTPEGVYDLAGNVAEWTADPAGIEGEERLIHPGAWDQPSMAAWAKAKTSEPPDARWAGLGFRLAREG